MYCDLVYLVSDLDRAWGLGVGAGIWNLGFVVDGFRVAEGAVFVFSVFGYRISEVLTVNLGSSASKHGFLVWHGLFKPARR